MKTTLIGLLKWLDDIIGKIWVASVIIVLVAAGTSRFLSLHHM